MKDIRKSAAALLAVLMLCSVLPFNLVKYGVTSVVTYLVYKRCGNALRSLLSVGKPAAV